ncbi:carbohydrate ABC transporter permease [Stackebrandtia nassauensis]|uniref:Binding-protein-dependent transport systems inner membrane component n=1 Tax=Stackebrandtia nassauensis (strain DSM 44728 / CIP 108903 / NRRL B-16338 / NBRC 102104 / LLR-40K-21) TaxID=446470 RepID=D3Q1S6_STANL|nr:carbohydrate ABC transporter permease [Stackebrandtia nassauensis]ADD39924.1 binding-protein-dependent transport systems inner membrane component [Stackebrandtia nassauensis DSM 44728]
MASSTSKRPGIAWYTMLIGLSLVFVAPLVWMFLTSFKTRNEALAIPPTFLPEEFSTKGYQTILGDDSQAPVLTWFLNSLLAAVGHTVLVLAVASGAAYALARMEFPGKKLIFGVIISTLLIPSFVLLIPNYLIVDSLQWIDTPLALIVPGAAGAFGVFFLRQFFTSLPPDLEEAAVLDGANHFQIFVKIVLPLSKPALATLAVLSFLSNWNDFIWPIYVMFSPENMTLPPGLATLQGAYGIDYHVLMAGAVITAVPVLALFLFTQRYVIEGVSRSGLKG